jgi:hypothetical protein
MDEEESHRLISRYKESNIWKNRYRLKNQY